MIERAFNEFPVLETGRLLLRRICADDAGALYGILSDEEVTRFYDDDAWTSRDQALEQIESWNLAYSRRASIRYGDSGVETHTGLRHARECGFYKSP